MALNNDQIICKLLKDEWTAIRNMIDYMSTYLRRVYNKILTITQRLKNTIIRRIVATIYELFGVIESYLGTEAFTNNMFRNKWCEVMYRCAPMIRKLSRWIGADFFNFIYGPDDVSTFDLEYFGLPKMHFTSKYEMYEYIACRLSLRGLLSQLAKDTVEAVQKFLDEYLQYIDLEYWLNRTGLGAKIKWLIKKYEEGFAFLKPYLDEMGRYIDCGFALCDFAASSVNYLDDFCSRYKITYDKTVTGTLDRNFKVFRKDLTIEIEDYMDSVRSEIMSVKTQSKQSIKPIEQIYDIKKKQNVGVTRKEKDEKAYVREEKTDPLTPVLALGFNTNNTRKTITITSPNSQVA